GPDSPQARGLRALALLAAGDRAGAAQVAGPMFEDGPGRIPRNHQFLLGAAFATELAAGLGIRPAARQPYHGPPPLARPAGVSRAGFGFGGGVAHHRGVRGAALGRPGEAAAHLERAVAGHERLGARPWALRSRYELARLRLAEPGQRDAAAAALAGIGAEAERLGMAGLARDAQAHAAGAGNTPLVTGVFRREGALWTLTYGGVT